MTGINLNVQNNYAALYSASSQQAINQATPADTLPTRSNLTDSGEKLTLSTAAIQRLQQEQQDTDSQINSPASNGFGLRPPPASSNNADATPTSNGFGLRPPPANANDSGASPASNGFGLRPPSP